MRSKSAIAEISTRGRARGASEIGNCRRRCHPSQSLTANHATTNNGSRVVLQVIALVRFLVDLLQEALAVALGFLGSDT